MTNDGFSPEDFKEEEELNTEEEPEGEFVILLRFYPFADMTCHWSLALNSTHSNST
jgi:hypothetical protein